MSKLAVFVEGLTEQLFVERLIKEIAGVRNLRFEIRKASGEVSDRRRFRLISLEPDSGQPHYVLIVDCSNDELVNSRIREEYEHLENAGYGLIIGLRDVYPRSPADIPKIRRLQYFKIRTQPIPVAFVLAIMETEAWFLAEYSHFQRIRADITPDIIKANFGFDPSCDDMEQRGKPSDDMADIYAFGGARYRKKRIELQRTVDLLDYTEICLTLSGRYAELGLLTRRITEFLFPD